MVSLSVHDSGSPQLSASASLGLAISPDVWQNVGSPDFSAGQAEYESRYVYDGTPYVAYEDVANGQYGYGPATVMEYTGGKWQSVGSPDFSASRATGESLFVYDGTPYVAYEDGGIGGKTTVMEYAAQPAQSYTVGVAASPVAGGTVIGGGAHTVGASVTVTAAANSGYTFTNWTENGDVVSASASYSFNMPADSLSLTANFTITTTTGGGGGGAPAVYTPTVQTEAASSVTTGSAALNGDITSSGNGNITEYGFLWGTSSSNLNNTLQVGTDNRSGAFTASLGSLTASTTYYFEAYATNSYGTADGAVLNFTIIAATPPLVPAPIFSDVPASFWAYSDIANLSGLGYVSGYPDGAFQPNSQITRAEVAAIMDKVLNLAPYNPAVTNIH